MRSKLSGIVCAAVLAVAANANAAELDKLPAKPGLPDLYISVVRPQAAGPVPTAILLHGGSGMNQPQIDSFAQWSDWLRQRGIASLIIDSQRGRNTQFAPPPRNVADYLKLLRERAGDAQRGLEWLATTGWADPQRLFVLGQSQGGTTALVGAVDHVLQVPQIDLYPLCIVAPKSVKLRDFPKSLWILGGKDELAPPNDCMLLRSAYLGAGADDISAVTIPGAYHAFDYPMPRPGTYLGKRVEFNATARDQARTEVERFLRELGYISTPAAK